jgi:hypothetical protein
MLPEQLLPLTTVRESGFGPIINIAGDGDRTAILALNITRITEREGLQISLWGSPDENEWSPLASFTNKFYCGEYELDVDLSSRPDVRKLRVQWRLDRGGRLGSRPVATLSVKAKSRHLTACSA